MKKWIGVILLMLIGLISGCFGQSGKAPFIRQYVLEYPPPQDVERPAVETIIRVERFLADRMFMGQEMLYRTGTFRREAYPTHRWRIGPGDMVTECLRRDLRESGLFHAVLSDRDAEEVRFSLAGRVEDFIESWEDKNRKALLTVTITLMDHSRKETAGWVVLQKTYRIEEAIVRDGAAGLASAMSVAMSNLSRQVITDIASALSAAGR